MFILIQRNLRLYFRDISDVILSLLSVFITIGVYILFLSKMQIDMVKDAVEHLTISDTDIKWLVNSWVVAGLLAITPVTSSLGGLGTLVYDSDKKITKDIKSAPIGKLTYPISVLISSCIIGIIMSLIPLVIYSIYIYIQSGHMFTLNQYIISIVLIIYTSVFSCSIMGFITSLLKSRSAFTSLSIITGTLVGFLDGVYMPMGMLPIGVQNFLKLVPFGSSAVLFRNIIMSGAIDTVLGNIPTVARDDYLETYGVKFFVDGKTLDLKWNILYMACWMVVAIVLYIISYNRKRNDY